MARARSPVLLLALASAGAAALPLAPGTGCSAEAPSAPGFPVTQDGACHRLLMVQCSCCGGARLNCENQVQWGVTQRTLWVGIPDGDCLARADAAERDAEALCRSLDSPAELEDACQRFEIPPVGTPEE